MKKFLSLTMLVLLSARAIASDPVVQPVRMMARVRADDVYGRLVKTSQRQLRVTQTLAGSDPGLDGLWIPLDAPIEAKSVHFDPPLPLRPRVDVVRIPEVLSDSWTIVPLSWSAAGIRQAAEAESFRVSIGRRGVAKAGIQTKKIAVTAECAQVQPPAPIRFPQRVADFEGGPFEPLGNRFGTFAGRGASVRTTRVRDAQGGRLVIDASLADEKSFAGLWLDLAPSAWLAEEEHGIDASALDRVVIRGRGRAGGDIKMSDVKAAKKDQGVLIGSLDTATEKDGSWTKVLTLPKGKLDQSRLRTLVVDLTRARLEHLELDEIVFLSAGDVVPARHRTNLTRIGAPLQRASWAWNTAAVLESETEKKKLLGTIARWKLTEIYLQLPHHRDDAESAAWRQGDRGAKLGTLIRDLHRAGVAVHALDGAPYLALRQAHGELAEIALTVKRFNESQPADSRFDALHLDIEPYLLPGFNSSRRRPILHEFANALRATKAAIAPLPLWIDIPFWFDSRDATTVERGARAGCARRDFLDEAMNIVDGIGIMAYRTNPDGADGIAAHALTEVQLANKLQRDVRVGLETIRLPPEVSWSVSLKSEPAMEPGKPLALFAADESHLLFTLAPTAADIAWIQKKPDSYRALKVTREDEAPAAKVTFFGRPKLDIEKAITETVELLSRGGAMTGGVAIHESRTLPE